VFASVLAATCSDPGTRVPTAPSAPAVQGIEINGPDTLARGQTAQYSVSVHLADGTVKDATAETHVIWRSDNPFIPVDQDTGVMTARGVGDAVLSADLATIGAGRATKEVVSVPEGTYRLVGLVSDAEFPDHRVHGARVEVTPGSLGTTTDIDGRYRLYGVRPDAEVRVTADGYEPAVRRVHLTGHAAEDVQLALPGPRLGLSGAYTLTIDVAGTCTALPADLQHRRYDAVVTQDGLTLDVTLTAPEFTLDSTGKGNTFSGAAAAERATFRLDALQFSYYSFYSPGYFTYPSVAETLPDGSILAAAGVAETTGSAAGVSGTLSGSVTRWSLDGRYPVTQGVCSSSEILFALTPR
jgi:hypothetical protein